MKKRLVCLLTIIALLGVTACSKPNEGTPDDPVISVHSEDAEMNAAIAKAKSTINEFTVKLGQANNEQATFFVKKPYATKSGGQEHIWVFVSKYNDGRFTGSVANEPYDVADLKMGQEVTVGVDEISDWRIMHKDGKDEGNFSEPVLMKRQGG